MNEWLTLVVAGLAGLVIGAVFFAGLWWTIRRAMASTRPALWFLASLMLRVGFAMGGIYLVSGGQWKRLLACLLGFVIARLLVTALAGSPLGDHAAPGTEAGHAP